MGLSSDGSTRYMYSGENKPKPSISHASNRIRRNSGRILKEMNADGPSRVGEAWATPRDERWPSTQPALKGHTRSYAASPIRTKRWPGAKDRPSLRGWADNESCWAAQCPTEVSAKPAAQSPALAVGLVRLRSKTGSCVCCVSLRSRNLDRPVGRRYNELRADIIG